MARVVAHHEIAERIHDEQLLRPLRRELREEFPKSGQAADALLKIGMLYQVDLKDKVNALATYREYLKLYPSSVVRSKVEETIKMLERS